MATMQELENGLRKAHAAGNADHARIFANEIRRQRQQPADFSGVSTSSDSTANRPEPRSFGQELGRTLGLGTRAMLEGVGSTLGIVTDPIAAGANALVNTVAPQQQTMAGMIRGENPADRQTFGTAREGFSGLADYIGLPTPETGTERVAGDITGALAGGGGLIGVGRGLAAQAPRAVQAVGNAFASQPTMQLVSAATGAGAAGATREAGGGQGAQIAAGLAGGLSPSFGVAGTQAAIRGAVRGGDAGRQAMRQTINDFNAVGATPSVGQAAGNRRMQGVESLLAGGPTSSGVMNRFAERQAEDIGAGLRQMGDDFMPNASAERAGRAVERGADLFAGNTGATKRALYWQADRFIPEATMVPVSNAWQKVVDLTSPTPGAVATTGAMVNPKIAQLRQALEQDLAAGGGQIPYAALKRVRTEIGEALGDYSLASDTPTREYRALYRELSRDMETAARAMGPEAERAARRANNYTRAVSERLEQVQRVVDKSGGPEKVYNAVMAGTKDGGTTLRAVMQSLPKDGQRAVTAAVIKRMGLANPGAQDAAGEAFSANTFLTNWNRVSPEAKRALFDRHGPKFAENMSQIARVADRIKSGSQVFANPSGTANRAAAIGYYGSLPATALIAGPGALAVQALSGVAANVAARVLTNPSAVAWMARATQMPVSALPQQIQVLKAQAREENDADLAAFADALEGAADQPGPGNNGADQHQ